jgi:hypothetical protein
MRRGICDLDDHSEKSKYLSLCNMYLIRSFLFPVEMCNIALCSDVCMVHKIKQVMNIFVYDF